MDYLTTHPIRCGFFPFHRGIMWPSLVKIRYTELNLLCGNLCGCPPAIPNHIIRPVSRRAYKKGCTRLAAASDTVYQLHAHGRWFSPGTPASSTTKTGRHNTAEILLKVALNTKNQSINSPPPHTHTLFKFTSHIIDHRRQ